MNPKRRRFQPATNVNFIATNILGPFLAFTALCVLATGGMAAVPWDGDGVDGNWFNPANWNRNENDNNTLPPGSPSTTDTEISSGTATLNGGLGVIYDTELSGADTNPYFPVPGTVNPAPDGFSFQHIAQLYISRSANPPSGALVPDNTLTLRGDLQSDGPVVVGRSSGISGMATNGKIIQQSGLFKVPLSNLDLGNAEAAPRVGFGNGTYDYQGGILEISQDGGSGLRLSAGGGGGVGGVGHFIMRNPGPTNPGHVRVYDLNVAANEGNATILANGTTNGVGIVEFRSNGDFGTRPIQINRNLLINNGGSGTLGAVRSARLDLVLDAAPSVNESGVPQDLGLFDVAFSDAAGTSTTGVGTLGDFFSSADGSALYNNGAIVSAMFGASTYRWNIYYDGEIRWSDADLGTLDTSFGGGDGISGPVGGGKDIVLIGLDSTIVSEGLTGDYNDDGVVDAADYVTWRKNQGTNNVLPNDPVGGMIGSVQYDNWRASFGLSNPGGGSLGAGVIPEPSSLLLALATMIGAALLRRRS